LNSSSASFVPVQSFHLTVSHFQHIRSSTATMRSYIALGAAALVAASPAPQAFDANALAAIPVTMTRGAPVGVGPSAVTGVYNQNVAIATAEAAVSAATTAAAVNKRSLEARTFCFFGYGYCPGNSVTKSSSTTTPVTKAPVTTAPSTTAPVTTAPTTTSAPVVTSVPNTVPSSCTPVDWTNTWAFTADPACATDIEVGTFCGFINPLDPCAPQPAAYGPLTVPDTPEAFKANTVLSQLALDAKTPSGYTQTFKNLNGAVNGNSYLAYKILTSYDVAGCAKYCDETELCSGFNVFIERDPAWNPDQCSCKNPASITQFKCSIFGSGVEESAAVNYGETRDEFKIVIVGSNGYEKSAPAPPTIPDTKPGQDCGDKIIDQPRYCLGEHSFPGPFDAKLCAAYAVKQNAVNVKAGLVSKILSLFGINPAKCAFFQAVELEVEGAAWGTHCRLFTKKFTKAQATLDIGAGKSKWGCKKSFGYELA
jgi:hypothetical protein